MQLSIAFCSPVAVPDDGFAYLFLRGPCGQEHRVPVQRSSPTTLTAILPGKVWGGLGSFVWGISLQERSSHFVSFTKRYSDADVFESIQGGRWGGGGGGGGGTKNKDY